ncbi:MAG: hypothetical protein LBD92_00070 [Oscillospiraceae bacterium]|nr:hypothetical protein [Oscillospiraceae bacterium]
MSSRRMLAVTIGGVALIALIIAFSALSSLLFHGPREFRLPGAQDSPPQQSSDVTGDARSGMTRVDVTVDNIQDVIRMLRRPESYSRDIMAESFWRGGNAAYNIGVTVMDGVTAMHSSSGGGAVKNIVVTDDTLYIWYNGDAAPYAGARDSAGDARRTADEYQMLITYEDILSLDRGELTDAGYVEYAGALVLFAEFRSGALGYVTRCYVSPELGLIVAAEQYDGDTLIYKMTAGACSVGEQDERAFDLPGGGSALPEPS